MLKKLIVVMVIVIGAAALALISYSFFAERGDLSRFTLSQGAGFFVEDPKELQKEVAPRLGYVTDGASL